MNNNNESVYLATLRLIEERGWVSGVPHGPNGEVCLAVGYTAACGKGALDLYRDKNASEAYIRLAGLIRDQYDMQLVDFNDHPDTTFEDVALVLKRADELWGAEFPAPSEP